MTRFVVKNFTHHPGRHCESTTMRNLIAHEGLFLTEEMIFGLDSSFGFIFMDNLGGSSSGDSFNMDFPIFIGAVLLISAVIFVTLRQKRSIYNRTKEITDNKTLEKYNLNAKVTLSADQDEEKPEDRYYSRDAVRTKPVQDAKVEEIRISRPHKEKEIIPVKSEEDETEKVINRKKLQKHDYDWFEGTDDVRYEIDKLTGEVDEENLDKWFEGVDGLKDKVKEKLKKKDKNKNNDKT